ncbi:MAG: hypothetical protein AAGK25_05285 [Pseudomonadota bacterium]
MTHLIQRSRAHRAPDIRQKNTVALVTPAHRRAVDIDALIKSLTTAGIALSPFTQAGVQNRHDAIALVDLRGVALTNDRQDRLLSTVRRRPFRLAFIVDEDCSSPFLDQLTDHADIISQSDLAGGHVAHRLKEMQRLVALEEEVTRRARVATATARKTSGGAYQSAIDQPFNILIAGSPGPTMLPLINLIEARGGETRAVYRPGQAIRALESGRFTGAIFSTEKTGDPLNALARAVHRHQRFYTMPVINITEQKSRSQSDSPAGRMITSECLLEKIYPILNSGHRRAARFRHFSQCAHQQCKETFEAYQTLSADARQHLIASHLHSIFERHDNAQTDAPFILLQTRRLARDTDGERKKAINSIFGGQVRDRLQKSVRKSDFMVPLSESAEQNIHAVYLPGTARDDLSRIAGRLESLLRSTALQDRKNPKPARTLVTSRGFVRPQGLRLEETVAGMIHRLSAV